MAKRRFPWTRGVLWLVAGILCWCGAAGALATREGLYDARRVSYRNANGTTTTADIRKMRNNIDGENGGTVTGWAQQLSQSLSVQETSGSAVVDVLWFDGDASLVWNLRPAAGHLPGTGDDEGIALDEKTALSLFGSLDVLGRTVQIAGEDVVVRGIFKLPDGVSTWGADPGRGIALCAAAVSGDVKITAIEFALKISDGTPAKEKAQQWMRDAGISTSGTFNDHVDERGLREIFVTVPAYVLAALALIEIIHAILALSRAVTAAWRAMRENRLTPARRKAGLLAGWGAGLLALAGVVLFIASMLPPLRSIPASYLPTQWSDFGFWTDQMTGNFQTAAKSALSVSLRPDMVYDTLTSWCTGLMLASVFCLWHSRSVLRWRAAKADWAEAALAGAIVCGAVPLALFVVGQIGWTPAAPTGLLALPATLYALIVALDVALLPQRWIGWVRRERRRRATVKRLNAKESVLSSKNKQIQNG